MADPLELKLTPEQIKSRLQFLKEEKSRAIQYRDHINGKTKKMIRILTNLMSAVGGGEVIPEFEKTYQIEMNKKAEQPEG